jgi:hypothetical protein
MPGPTYANIADACKQAVFDLVSGKIASYTISGRSFTFANLKDLVTIEQQMRELAGTETVGNFGCVTQADLSGGG